MGALAKLADWRLKFFLWVGLPVIAAIGLLFGTADLVPAWQAKSGTGVAGTFTADREDCGRRSCSFYGTWVSSDGNKARTDVILYDEPDSLLVGAHLPAAQGRTGDTAGRPQRQLTYAL